MLKTVLLGATVMISMPALAQTAPSSATSSPTSTAAPAQTMPQTTPDTTMTTPVTTPQTNTSQATPDAVAPTPGAATTSTADAGTTSGNDSSAVQQVVDQSWTKYDKDGNGVLSKAEFTAWMVDLRKQTDPKASTASAKTEAWANGAFLTADKDKSKTVSKTELATYLSGGSGGAGSK